MALRSVKTSHATTNIAMCIPAEISTYCSAYCNTNEPYKTAIIYVAQCKELYYNIILIKYQANSHQPIQQTFIFLRVHQYALIKQSAIYIYIYIMCILYGMMYCIILIEYSSIVNISRPQPIMLKILPIMLLSSA